MTAGRPEIFCAATVSTSQGFVTRTYTASGACGEQLRHELFEDADIGPGQIQPRLARCLLGASGDNHDVGPVRGADVSASGDGRRRCRELGAVGQVQHLGFGFGLH